MAGVDPLPAVVILRSGLSRTSLYGQEETVEYFPHSGHSIRIIITYADRRPRNIGNEPICNCASAHSENFNSPHWSVW